MTDIIQYQFYSLVDGLEKIKAVCKEQLQFKIGEATVFVRLDEMFDEMHQDLQVLIEYPYVDKVYRDSYYYYYSSKNQKYERDCIKVSVFDSSAQEGWFRDSSKLDELDQSYLGYLVIRPTIPQIIGRTWIDPSAFLTNHYKICKAPSSTTSAGIKFSVNSFPHSSQNSETMACAESTIWAVMEYFGMKYPEYTPTLPSKITEVLKNYSSERLLPSKGLRFDQISFALNKFGFGVQGYHQNSFKDEFFKILRTYIESGIPVIVAIKNENVGHAQIVIGRAKFDDDHIDNLVAVPLGNGSSVALIEDIPLDYIFIDDNKPPFQMAALETPTSFYLPEHTQFADAKISSFVVPLYSKIYLEAASARKYFKIFLTAFQNEFQLYQNTEFVLKIFLASSRSYKDYVVRESDMHPLQAEIILVEPMPKFIWLAELSTRDLIKQNKANGLLIIDATETHQHGLLAGFIENHYFVHKMNKDVRMKNVPLQSFNCYNKNLS
jgi:hypothetical protein